MSIALTRRALVPLALVALASHGCADTLDDGELGTPRVAGFVRGAPPDVRVFAPVSDRSGNIYLLSGKSDVRDLEVFVGRAGGGFSSGCRLTKGDSFGPHGWVGSSVAARGVSASGRDQSRTDRQWYWSGSALVSVSALGDCRRVLDRDPSTGTDLLFDAVVPWVNDTPSKTTLVALVRATQEALPFTVRVDLNANIYSVPRPFEPTSATNLVVHGVGANAAAREGWVLLSYDTGGAKRTEARFYDENGELLSQAPITGASELGPYAIRGFMQQNESGLVAGLTADNRLVVFDRDRGKVIPVGGLEPVGVHVWKGALYLVGTAGGRPVVSSIDDDGRISTPSAWESSRQLAATYAEGLAVTDDCAPPRRTSRFDRARATSAFPLLTEHSSFAYADGSTLVTIAGPTVGEGDSAFTLVAVAPAGISYP